MKKLFCFENSPRHFFCLIALALIFSTSQARADVQFETSRSAGSFASLGVRPASITIAAHPIGNGANRAIFVGVSTQTTMIPLAVNRVTRVTFGAQNACPAPLPQTVSTCEFTRVNAIATFSPDNQNAVEIFQLINPPNETRDIEISLIAAGVDYVVAGSASFTGVSQTTPSGAYNQSSGTYNQAAGTLQPSVTVADGISGEIVFDVLSFSFGGSSLPDAGQTLLYQGRSFFGGVADVGAGGIKPDTTVNSTDNVTLSWQLNADASWALGAIAIKQSLVSASPASIGGQVKTINEEPLANVSIALQNLENGEIFYTTSDENGFYNFPDLQLTNLYRIEAFSRFYNFSPDSQTVNLIESLEGINFYGSPRKRINKFIRQGIFK